MFSSRFALKRIAALAALAIGAGGVTSTVQAEEVDTVYSVSAGYEFSSHFISYGFDVWQGGAENWEPWNSSSTMFGYATVGAQISDEFSLSLNVWSDLNNNTDSSIGDFVQEVDVNLGATYKLENGLSFTASVGQWMYANDIEGIFDFTVAYDDTDKLIDGVGFMPYAMVHYRWDPNGAQEDDSAAIVLGIRPTYTIMPDSSYPITFALPASVAIFTDEFQGGDSGFGYANVGVSATVPLAFIPPEYGNWSSTLNVMYWHTPDDTIPGNPNENFITTSLSVNVAF